jgi:hypothetical protein
MFLVLLFGLIGFWVFFKPPLRQSIALIERPIVHHLIFIDLAQTLLVQLPNVAVCSIKLSIAKRLVALTCHAFGCTGVYLAGVPIAKLYRSNLNRCVIKKWCGFSKLRTRKGDAKECTGTVT